jgi:hypothetical protein
LLCLHSYTTQPQHNGSKISAETLQNPATLLNVKLPSTFSRPKSKQASGRKQQVSHAHKHQEFGPVFNHGSAHESEEWQFPLCYCHCSNVHMKYKVLMAKLVPALVLALSCAPFSGAHPRLCAPSTPSLQQLSFAQTITLDAETTHAKVKRARARVWCLVLALQIMRRRFPA